MDGRPSPRPGQIYSPRRAEGRFRVKGGKRELNSIRGYMLLIRQPPMGTQWNQRTFFLSSFGIPVRGLPSVPHTFLPCKTRRPLSKLDGLAQPTPGLPPHHISSGSERLITQEQGAQFGRNVPYFREVDPLNGWKASAPRACGGGSLF